MQSSSIGFDWIQISSMECKITQLNAIPGCPGNQVPKGAPQRPRRAALRPSDPPALGAPGLAFAAPASATAYPT